MYNAVSAVEGFKDLVEVGSFRVSVLIETRGISIIGLDVAIDLDDANKRTTTHNGEIDQGKETFSILSISSSANRTRDTKEEL